MNQKMADATAQQRMMPCQLSATFCCNMAQADAAMAIQGSLQPSVLAELCCDLVVFWPASRTVILWPSTAASKREQRRDRITVIRCNVIAAFAGGLRSRRVVNF